MTTPAQERILAEWFNAMSDSEECMTSLMLANVSNDGRVAYSPSGLLCGLYMAKYGTCDTCWVSAKDLLPDACSSELVLSHNGSIYCGFAPRSIYEWAGVDSHWAVKELEPVWSELHCNLTYLGALGRLFSTVLRKEFPKVHR